MKKVLALTCCCVDIFPQKNIISAGGNALNVAASCSKSQKAEAFLMGNIGTDIYGKKIKETADKYNINRQKLNEIKGESASNKIYLTEGGDRYFEAASWTNGVYGDYRISENDENFMKSFDAVATTFNDPNFHHILKIGLESPFLLSVDFLNNIPRDEWREFLPSIDLFFISGKKWHLPLLEKWSEEYSALFVATLGEEGSVAYKNGKEYCCEAVKVQEVVDTTGCGDSYQGAFIADYLTNNDALSAMKAGSEAAVVTLSFVGAC
ncbi:MAG: PfkB family carbohydrate kinase [Chitinispirillales bacterium]|jgi:fructoselysine 6-kinase|nr:PfkB family carbohydrate kinase [Chitinispirillales bacterium]